MEHLVYRVMWESGWVIRKTNGIVQDNLTMEIVKNIISHVAADFMSAK